jgi:hypothetical protein
MPVAENNAVNDLSGNPRHWPSRDRVEGALGLIIVDARMRGLLVIPTFGEEFG